MIMVMVIGQAFVPQDHDHGHNRSVLFVPQDHGLGDGNRSVFCLYLKIMIIVMVIGQSFVCTARS